MLHFDLSVEAHCSSILCRIIDVACCIDMVLISVKVCLIVFSSILNFSSKIFIEGMFSIGIVGSLYIIVYAGMCAITCVSRKGPMCGV